MNNKNLHRGKENDDPGNSEEWKKQSDDESTSGTQLHSEKRSSSEKIQPKSILSSPKTVVSESSGQNDSATNEKKGRNLRFVLLDATEEHKDGGSKFACSQRSSEKIDTGSVGNFRITPVPRHKPIHFSDILRAVHVVANEEFATSTYFDTENDSITSSYLPHRSVVNILRSEPNSEADCRLLLSTHFRNLNGVIEALNMGANVNVVQDYQTPIALATENNDKLIVKHLLSTENINVNSKNIFGQTPLLIAIRNGYTEIAIWLLNHEADVNLSDNLQRTALHEALFQENATIVELILDRQCQLEKMDCFGEKPIYTAAVKKPNVDLLNNLLKAGAACEYINEINGISLLSRAILGSLSYQIIQRLIEAEANVNEEDVFCKRTPLHVAAIINSIPIAKLLIEKGADPNAKTISGLTALDLAIYYKCFDIAEYLAPITTSPNLNIEILKNNLLSRISNNACAFIKFKTSTGLRTFTKKSK